MRYTHCLSHGRGVPPADATQLRMGLRMGLRLCGRRAAVRAAGVGVRAREVGDERGSSVRQAVGAGALTLGLLGAVLLPVAVPAVAGHLVERGSLRARPPVSVDGRWVVARACCCRRRVRCFSHSRRRLAAPEHAREDEIGGALPEGVVAKSPPCLRTSYLACPRDACGRAAACLPPWPCLLAAAPPKLQCLGVLLLWPFQCRSRPLCRWM
jgi:hypothetical protein